MILVLTHTGNEDIKNLMIYILPFSKKPIP